MELRTAAKPARIVLETDRQTLPSDWESVAFVTARVVDENGVTAPAADNAIAFEVQGPGFILATDNGDLASHEPFQSHERHAFEGRAVALIVARGGGKITVSARAEDSPPVPSRLWGRNENTAGRAMARFRCGGRRAPSSARRISAPRGTARRWTRRPSRRPSTPRRKAAGRWCSLTAPT